MRLRHKGPKVLISMRLQSLSPCFSILVPAQRSRRAGIGEPTNLSAFILHATKAYGSPTPKLRFAQS